MKRYVLACEGLLRVTCWKPNSLSATHRTSSAWSQTNKQKGVWNKTLIHNVYHFLEHRKNDRGRHVNTHLFNSIFRILWQDEKNFPIPELCHHPLLLPALQRQQWRSCSHNQTITNQPDTLWNRLASLQQIFTLQIKSDLITAGVGEDWKDYKYVILALLFYILLRHTVPKTFWQFQILTMCTLVNVENNRVLKQSKSYHKLDGVKEALVELGVLEIVLWVVGTVNHSTWAAGHCSKLLLACILVWGPINTHKGALIISTTKQTTNNSIVCQK